MSENSSNLAIVAEQLSKQYVLGARERGYRTLRETIVDAMKAPVRRLRNVGRAGTDSVGESFWALRDVSFQVRTGEVVGIIGRNGAGKSTLLKVLSRIVSPTDGRALIHGRVASLLEVGTGFHPELTGRENIFLNGAILGMRRAEILRRFDEIVEFAEIERFLDTPVKRYSSGMYVRLAFSVAAHLDPEILIVDEVLAVGDGKFQKKCLGKMRDVTSGGRTVLFVSHNLSAVSSLCDRVIMLESGQVAFDGPSAEGVPLYVASTMGDAALSWDLAALPREQEHLGEQALLERAAAFPASGAAFRMGEPMRFDVTFTAHAELDDLNVVLNVDDLNGTRIATVQTDVRALGLRMEAGRRYTVEAVLREPVLMPGRYLLTTSLYSGQQWYDWARQFGSFEVSTLLHGSDEYVVVPPGAGVARASADWHGEVAAGHAAGAAPAAALTVVEAAS